MAVNNFDWIKMTRRKNRFREESKCLPNKKEVKLLPTQNPFKFPEILAHLLNFVDLPTTKNLRQVSTDLNELATKSTLKQNYLSLGPLDDQRWTGVDQEFSLIRLTFAHSMAKVFANLKIPSSLLKQQMDLTELIMTKLPDLDLFVLFGNVIKLRICVDNNPNDDHDHDHNGSFYSDDALRTFQMTQQLPNLKSLHLPNFGYVFDNDEVSENDPQVASQLGSINQLFLDRIDNAVVKLVTSNSNHVITDGGRVNNNVLPECVKKLTIFQKADLPAQICEESDEEDDVCWSFLKNYCLKNCQWHITTMTLCVEPEMEIQVVRQFLTTFNLTLTHLDLSFVNNGGESEIDHGGDDAKITTSCLPTSLKKLTSLSLTCWYPTWSPRPLFWALGSATELPKLSTLTVYEIPKLGAGQMDTLIGEKKVGSKSLTHLIVETDNLSIFEGPVVNLWPLLKCLEVTKATKQVVLLIFEQFSTKICGLEELTLDLKKGCKQQASLVNGDDGDDDWDCVLTGVRRVTIFDNRFAQNLPAKRIEFCGRRSIGNFQSLKKLHISNKECEPLTNFFLYHGLILMKNLTRVVIEGAKVTPKAVTDVRQSLGSAAGAVIQIDHQNGHSCCEQGCNETCVEWTEFPGKPFLFQPRSASSWPASFPHHDSDHAEEGEDGGGSLKLKKILKRGKKRMTSRQKGRQRRRVGQKSKKIIHERETFGNFVGGGRKIKGKMVRKRLKSECDFLDYDYLFDEY